MTNEENYKNNCDQLEYEQNKYNEAANAWRIKENGMTTVINALTEMKDQYEMKGSE